jgi:TRAP-type C4-dicarboxylate transport system permease small subunit
MQTGSGVTSREAAAAAPPAARPASRPAARFRAAYGHALEWLVAALMIVLFVEVTLGVVYRAFGSALIWYDELASHLLAWLTFYGSALASVKRAHIGCPEVVEAMPWRLRRGVNLVAQVLVIAFFALLAYVGIMVMPVLATDYLVSLPEVPMSLVQSVIPISAMMILAAEIAYFIQLWRAGDPAALADGTPAAAADALH